jgi:hypothetical protein
MLVRTARKMSLRSSEFTGSSPTESLAGLLITIISCRQSKFATFPEVLVLHARKFQLVNWVPAKLGKSYFPISCPHQLTTLS